MQEPEKLPDEVHLTKFAGARAREITILTKCISGPLKTKVAFQTLPVHMRRRVMSHNSRRLPRRLHFTIPGEDEEGGFSRRGRRRPRRLLAHFERRQKQHAWLETHIWHAKRFRMKKIWGYNLPEAPCDKAFRACYRAGSAHCLLLDVSYLGCIQLSGSVENLTRGFASITSSKCGLTTNAKCYMNGEREGSTYIYNINKYPRECLGKVSFIWDICDVSNATIRFFVHPSLYLDSIELFKKCFELIKVNSKAVIDSTSSIFNSNRYNSKMSIEMIELNKVFNRFRLIGPLSHAVLKDVLRPIDVTQREHDSENWFKNLFVDTVKEKHLLQSKYWEKINGLNSPAEIQSKIILGLNVEDPRLNFPKKRTKSLPNYTNSCMNSMSDIINIPKNLSYSLLWKNDVQKNVLDKKITNAEINKIRHDTNLVPGEPNSLLQNISGIPVVLIQNPGSKDPRYKKIGYNSGWDIIIPAGYGMPFWLSLILRGARAGGLREASQLLFENGICDFQPDTPAGKSENIRQETILKDRYFKLPPKKRVNYRKLSINSPFICRWKELLINWNENIDIQEDYFVMRERKALQELQEMLKNGVINHNYSWDTNCLVPVRISMKNKGKVTNNALICIPSNNDVNKIDTDLVEPLKKDENYKARKELRSKHKKQLKILRKKSIRRKRKILAMTKTAIVPKQNNTNMIMKYLSEMQELWLPSDFKNVRNQCSRETIGYVAKGDFSFSDAKSVGIGYVALKSILCLLRKFSTNKNLVLIRNTLSRQYRFAYIEIIPDMLI